MASNAPLYTKSDIHREIEDVCARVRQSDAEVVQNIAYIGTLARSPQALAYSTINRPEYSLFEGRHGATLSGPFQPATDTDLYNHLASLFGSDGLRVHYKHQRFTAYLTGEAYARFQEAHRAYEDLCPESLGH